MSRIQSIHWKEFEKFLFKIGCEFKRERGDHRVYWKKGIKRPVIIPRDKSLPAFIILNNLRVLGVSREEYLAIVNHK
ncbi:MAG: type II toxin-antitoxin system HicA family toxin [Candidatus Liptonbacteria bacterium]|nr:type II toxin-antitoxin system HicA family toxin [Candidatus Liptonbacteria bacterium]